MMHTNAQTTPPTTQTHTFTHTVVASLRHVLLAPTLLLLPHPIAPLDVATNVYLLHTLSHWVYFEHLHSHHHHRAHHPWDPLTSQQHVLLHSTTLSALLLHRRIVSVGMISKTNLWVGGPGWCAPPWVGWWVLDWMIVHADGWQMAGVLVLPPGGVYWGV